MSSSPLEVSINIEISKLIHYFGGGRKPIRDAIQVPARAKKDIEILHRLAHREWIKESSLPSGIKKANIHYFTLTEQGLGAIKLEVERVREMAERANQSRSSRSVRLNPILQALNIA